MAQIVTVDLAKAALESCGYGIEAIHQINEGSKAQHFHINFENVTFTIKSGTRVNGANFGLFAGTVSEGAQISNVKIENSTLQIDSGSYFGTDDYCLGLVSGLGNTGIDHSGITCTAVGDNADSLIITVNDGIVTLETKQ